MGWQKDPIGLRYSLNQMYDRYHKPIFILEMAWVPLTSWRRTEASMTRTALIIWPLILHSSRKLCGMEWMCADIICGV